MRSRVPTQWSLASVMLAVLTAELVGCNRCGMPAQPGRGLAPLISLLPRTAQAVFLVPRLRSLEPAIQKLELLKLTTLASQLQGFESGRDFLSAVISQVGIDFRSPSALTKAGIDPEGAFALVIPSGGEAYAVIPVQDPARFHDALAELARNRIGAPVETVSDRAGQKVTSFASKGSPHPDLGFVARAGFAFVAAAAMVSELPRHAAIDAEQSLALEPSLTSALKQSGGSSLAYAWLSPRFAWSSTWAPAGATLDLDVTSQQLRVRAHAPWETGSILSALKVQPSSQSLLEYLPQDSFLVARFAGPPERLGPILQRLMGKAGDPAFDNVLANLAPGMIASLSLSPTAVLSPMPILDVRKSNPFHFFHFVALAPVRNREQARQLLAQSPALGSRVGVRIEERQEQGEKIFVSTYAQGEGAHLALVGQTAAIGSPLEIFLDVVRRLKSSSNAAQGPLPDPKLRRELDRAAAAVVIDLPRLASSIRSLPNSSWGVGGFAIRAAALLWLNALEDLRGLSVHFSGSEQSMELEVTLHFAGT